MARLYNLARVLSTTAGTGPVTLGPAVQGFLTFAQAGVPNGTEVSYGIRDGANSEVGTGVYSSTGPTLTRTSVTNSTNLGAYINLSGSEEVYITARAEDLNDIVPFDAMAYSGMQINGGMEVSQEYGTSAIGIGAARYIIDGWHFTSTGSQIMSGQQVMTGSPPGYTSYVNASAAGANAAPAAGHFAFLSQRIEGYRVARLAWGTANAQPVTIGFWVSTGRAGMYSGALLNGANNRSYPFTFTINAIGTWEYKTVTILGDTTGTWAKDNTIGLYVLFTMMAGSTFTAPAGAWTAGTFFGATGTINGVAATTDQMNITGVTILPGTQAPTAAQSPNIMRPFGEELQTCKRYWQKTYSYGTAPGTGTNVGAMCVSASTNYILSCGTFSFPVEMRASPTMTVYSAVGSLTYVSDYNTGDGFTGDRLITLGGSSTKNHFIIGQLGDFTVSTNKRFHWIADARL